ncbi:hypothetical protein GOEFS_119_00120 [Gordonia effusa NBRC 100432]|uniref:Cutinase n=1 Tax=Gordonia effusa NBRC 100432 TaxID=1077974 RepID=H0R621_9ACTN|nr:cutinase family protein [Gordonia effusa]GAB20522.1 hypothetical protein GOEFS_119_00120 [Gordonia effusa NBRC 100432]
MTARRWIAAASVVLVALLAVAVSSSVSTSSAAGDCTPVVQIAVPGTWETNTTANPNVPVGMLKSVTDSIAKKFGSSIRTIYLPYPADAFKKIPYLTSKSAGTSRLNAELSAISRSCPDTAVVILGYSQGADIGGDTASTIGTSNAPIGANKVLAVGLLADPGRGTSGEITVGPNPGGSGIVGPRPKGMGSLSGRVATICAPKTAKAGSADLYCGISSSKDPFLTGLGTILGKSGPTTTTTGETTTTGDTTTPNLTAPTTDLAAPTTTTGPTATTPNQGQTPTQGTESTGSPTGADSLASSLTSNLNGEDLTKLGDTASKLTGNAQSSTVDVGGLAQTATSLLSVLTPLASIAQSAASDPSLTNKLTKSPSGTPENAAGQVLSAAGKVDLNQVVSMAGQLAQTANGLSGQKVSTTSQQGQQLTSTANALKTQISPLTSTPTDTLSTASSVLSVLQPQVIVDQVLNVATNMGAMVSNLPAILADLQKLPQAIAALNVDEVHRLAGDLNNKFSPLVKLAAAVDYKAASQVVGLIPDPQGYTQIAAMVLSVLSNVDIIRLANDIGQAQEIAWNALKNPAALTGLLPIGLDLATVAAGMFSGTASKTDPSLLGNTSNSALSGQTSTLVNQAQNQNLSGLVSSLTGLAGSQGAQDLTKLIGQGLDAASFYASGTHTNYASLVVDQHGRTALTWLADWISRSVTSYLQQRT